MMVFSGSEMRLFSDYGPAACSCGQGDVRFGSIKLELSSVWTPQRGFISVDLFGEGEFHKQHSVLRI